MERRFNKYSMIEDNFNYLKISSNELKYLQIFEHVFK